MLKVVHWLKKDKLTKDLDKASFLLSNKQGGYLYLGTKAETKNQGFFFNENFTMFKAIENLQIDGTIIKTTNKFSSLILERDNQSTEEYTLPFGHNSFIYEVKKYKGDLILNLDSREFNDNDQWGRFYNIQIDKNQILITYEKQGDYWIFITITGKNLQAEKIREWRGAFYKLDEQRKDEANKQIYTALRIKINHDTKLVFSASTDKDKAIEEGDYVYRNINKLKRKQDNAMLYKNVIKNKEKRMAYNAALNSLNGLLSDVDDKLGILRGFPWYYKYWSRDEMISIKALGKRKEASDIYSRTLWNIQDNGKLPSRTLPTVGDTADGAGLFYYRFGKKDELNKVLKSLQEKSIIEGFLTAERRETWMDTIDREGTKIELQALLLNMYKLNGERKLESKLKKEVKEKFWNKKYLNDGIDDPTIRPNLFLAYYYYPDLLSKDEWIRCFKSIIPKLWCTWGGISTLDKKSKGFEAIHTGINPNSYHNGDSHFFMNNLTATILMGLNKKEFKNQIKNIVEASTQEILWNGILGHHAEMSSARKMSSDGCRCEAKAAATYIELLNIL